ncbi:MAG: extracellular solute-binding protein [Thermofilaceae archaeon]
MNAKKAFLILVLVSIALVLAPSYASPEVKPDPNVKYEDTLVIITPTQADLLNAVVQGFKDYVKRELDFDLNVQLIRVGSPEAMNRIIAWAGRPEVDIFYGGDIIYHWKLKSLGLLESYKPRSPYYDRLPSSYRGLPIKDPDEMWHPKLWWGHGFMYNTEVLRRFNLEPPKSWDELLDPKWEDLIVMCTPSRSSSTYINVMIIIQNRGWDEGWGYWRRLAANVGAFVPRSHDVLELVSKGEYAVGFIYAQGVVLNKAKGYPVAVFMDPTGFIVSGVSLLKGAPHPNIAKLFLDWWYTPEAQSIALRFGGIPVLPEVVIEGEEGTPGAILKEYMGGKRNVYEYLDTFANVRFYNFTFAEQAFANVSKIFDDTIVARHNELKEAWKTIRSVEETVEGISAAEEKLKSAVNAFDAGDYATAKSLALEAEQVAAGERARIQMMTQAAIVIVVIAVIAAAVFVVVRRKRK